MKRWQKILIGIVLLIIVLAILNFFGIVKVNLARRSVYAGCDSGCNTNLSNVNDCIGFLDYLKKTEPQFVANAKAIGINLDKPDEIAKTVATDGHIRCWYYAN